MMRVPVLIFISCILLVEAEILVFGGTGNMGIETVNTLLKAGYKLVLVSRGNWRFDSETLIKPRVRHISCDRYQPCSELDDYVTRTTRIDAVVDFSAYNVEVVERAIQILQNKVGVYIYISSDSVYEVSKKGDVPSKESDAIRPEDTEEQERLNAQDYYGHQKLQIEEALIEQRKNGGFPYAILRLPDVIGPRDTTQRWWPLQLWIKHFHVINRAIVLDRSLENITTSLVYTKDVASAIYRVIEAGDIAHNQIYNLGFDRTFTYTDIITGIAKELKVKNVSYDPDMSGQQFYPSVRRGPVNTQKIKQQLGFKPTEWERALKNTVAWYERAYYEYPQYFSHIVDILINQIVPDEHVAAFQEAVRKKPERYEL